MLRGGRSPRPACVATVNPRHTSMPILETIADMAGYGGDTHIYLLCRLIQPMLHELEALTAARSGHNATMNVGAGVLGSRILQILEVMASIVVPPPPKKNPHNPYLVSFQPSRDESIGHILMSFVFCEFTLLSAPWAALGNLIGKHVPCMRAFHHRLAGMLPLRNDSDVCCSTAAWLCIQGREDAKGLIKSWA